MPVHIKVGSVWKSSTPWVKVGSTWKQATQVYINVGGVWKPCAVGTVNIVSTNPQTVQSWGFNLESASASVQVGNTGWIYYNWNDTGPNNETWITPQSGMPQFDVRAVKTSGNGTVWGSALSTWLNCGTSRTWGVTSSAGSNNTKNATLQISISETGQATPLDTVTVELSAITTNIPP